MISRMAATFLYIRASCTPKPTGSFFAPKQTPCALYYCDKLTV